MKKYSTILQFVIAAIFILSTASAGYTQEEKTAAPVFNSSSKIGIIPFFQGKFDINSDEPEDKILTCSIEELCFISEDIMPGADEKLTNYTQTALTKRLGNQILPKDVVKVANSKIRVYQSGATPKSIAIKTGKATGADVIIVGSVWRYKNRISAKGSSDQPTSVAFVVYLLDVPTGNTIWKNSFVKSQTALTDDISNIKLVFKGGVKWLKADELAKFGVDEVFNEFPY